MIKASELRCGNRIQFAEKMQPRGAYGDPGPFMTVYGIIEQVKVSNSDILPGPGWEQIWLHSFLGPIDPERLAGIPLTSDILEKCGFEPMRGEDDDPDYAATGWRAYYSASYMEGGKGHFCIWNNQPGGYLMDNYSSAPLNYLHQLQNLFYCLCGEELRVNL